MPEPNTTAVLKRTSLNVYGADIFNCSRQTRFTRDLAQFYDGTGVKATVIMDLSRSWGVRRISRTPY
jgi:hypothetical protein